MRVVVLGAGLMGAQIGIEYLSGGHDVTFDPDALRRRVDDGLALAEQLGLDAGSAERSLASPGEAIGEFDLVVESLPENLELKASLLGPFVSALPDAAVATNTSSLSITALGDAVGAPDDVAEGGREPAAGAAAGVRADNATPMARAAPGGAAGDSQPPGGRRAEGRGRCRLTS